MARPYEIRRSYGSIIDVSKSKASYGMQVQIKDTIHSSKSHTTFWNHKILRKTYIFIHNKNKFQIRLSQHEK